MSLSVALVTMPWWTARTPSTELGVLTAYLRRERPSYRVTPTFAYLDIAARIGLKAYGAIALRAATLGETLYLPSLYPEHLLRARIGWIGAAENILGPLEHPGALVRGASAWGDVYDHIRTHLAEHLQELAGRVAAEANVLALTASYCTASQGQLFGALALARQYKDLRPGGVVVLTGSHVAGRVGPSLLSEYPWLDFAVQGDIEHRLLALLDAAEEGRDAPPIHGVLSRRLQGTAPGPGTVAIRDISPSRGGRRAIPAETSRAPDSLDDLPFPDFDVYAERAERLGCAWSVQVEGSRGCWWDRTVRSGDPRSTCHFCSLTVNSRAYREKSPERLAAEIAWLCKRYERLDVDFLDLIVRHKGISELATALQATGLDLTLFMEMRAQITPRELVLLWQAGLRATQLGIEGLSSSYLKRIGKGTTTIQNLRAMKTCEELGIKNGANLLINFPGATADEIEETRRTILRYALPFQPCELSSFQLSVGSTVESMPEAYGIGNVRNSELFRAGMPREVWQRLQLFNLDFDWLSPRASWSVVREACAIWQVKYNSSAGPLLSYRDGGSFLAIRDARGDTEEEIVLRGAERELYLYCCDIRSAAQISARFADADLDVRQSLERFARADLLFEEEGRYLSLAMANSAGAAARRILAG